jgi:UDP-N-acetylmuramate dehydrogenase
MKNEVLVQKFAEIDGVEFRPDEDLSRHSSMGLVASGALVLVKNVEALKKVLLISRESAIDLQVVGMGSNFLFPQTSETVYLKLILPVTKGELSAVKDMYVLPASLSLGILTVFAKKFGLKGWEVFTGIPGSLGGAVWMNAGTNLGSIGDLVKWVKVVDRNGDERTVESGPGAFSYRKINFLNADDIILEVAIGHHGVSPEIPSLIEKYMDARIKTQPLSARTCGCVFKNISSACRVGAFIDILGLKGFTVGGIRVSRVHGNFFENTGGAALPDFQRACEFVRKELKLHFGLDFEYEVVMPSSDKNSR